MRKTFLLGLMAAVAIVPAMASAQDRGGWRSRGGNNGGSPTASQPQSNGGGWRNGNGGGWRGRGDGASTPTPSPAPAPAPTARSEGGARAGGWAGRNSGNGGWAGRNGGNGGVANDQARGRPDGNRWNGSGVTNGSRLGGWAGRNNDGVAPDANAQARAQAEARARADRNRSFGNNNNWRNGRNNGWNGANRNWGGDNRWRGNDGNRGGNWNRGWRGDNRYDWQRYRTSNRNIFRLPRYYAPYGWSYGYRRFSIGFVLDQVLFGQNYWIDDPYEYRLPEADGEFRWVRYYNDALLVDIYTGEVVDVVYDIFY